MAGLICNPCTRLVLHRLDSRLRGNDGEKSPGLVGPAAPPGRVWAPCILLRGQATAPTWGFALDHHLGRTGGPAGKGLGTVHSASRPGDRSHLGICARSSPWWDRRPRREGLLVGATASSRRVWAPCILHRGQAAAPTGMVRTCWVFRTRVRTIVILAKAGIHVGFQGHGFGLPLRPALAISANLSRLSSRRCPDQL